jgi:hypothetical protein
MTKPASERRRLLGAITMIACLGLAAAGSRAVPQEKERGLRVAPFGSARPKSQAAGPPQGPRVYKSATATAAADTAATPGAAAESVVGITVWRLRPSGSADDKEARLLEHEGTRETEWTPERVGSETALREGDRVRLSIEVPRDGYLYVIDRERYSDGRVGGAYLIFPTAHTLDGNNKVTAGRVIEIPAQEDSPPYFTLSRSRADHVAEVVSVLVTPTPLAGVTPGQSAIKIPEGQMSLWEKQWGLAADRVELEGGAAIH